MEPISYLTAADVQQRLAEQTRRLRRRKRWSRQALAERSTVPASTIKKFETSGQISLRQFILLWQCVDSLDALARIATESEVGPCSISDVLSQ